MNTTILIPHYKTGKLTAHCISKILEYRGKHEINIIVIDNSPGDDSIGYIEPFAEEVLLISYPPDRLQSHGISFDWAMPFVITKTLITLESDSFPTNDKWLDYIEERLNEGYDMGASFMQLSGGYYGHPAGAFYTRKLWEEAKEYCDNIEYSYFPNMSIRENFDCHLMVHKSILFDFLDNTEDYIELANGYKGLTQQQMLAKRDYYKPVVGPFHNGMGTRQESVNTYGRKNLESEVPTTLLDNKAKLINRVGSEPGQWLSYFALATGKKVFQIPTEIKWMPNREGQQQEYTLTENGLKHIWGGSAYLDNFRPEDQDIAIPKRNVQDALYNSLPDHQKIKQ